MHFRSTGSFAGMGLRSAILRTGHSTPPWRPMFPEFLDRDFVTRTQLYERWEWIWSEMLGSSGAYHQLSNPWTSRVARTYESLNFPCAARHPFWDVRLASFLLGLPSYMKAGKRIMRSSMHGLLPEEVRTRPKTPALGDVVRTKFERNMMDSKISSDLSLVQGRFVDGDRYRLAMNRYILRSDELSTWPTVMMVGPIGLNMWLGQHISP